MRRVEVCHFCLTKNPKSPWHQGIDVATATLQLMFILMTGSIIMVYEIISTYLGRKCHPKQQIPFQQPGALFAFLNHPVPWWRPELLSKQVSPLPCIQHLCVQFVYQTLEYPYPFLWKMSCLNSKVHREPLKKSFKSSTFWVPFPEETISRFSRQQGRKYFKPRTL